MKNSFVLYFDQVDIFKKLPPEQAKNLILKIFEYAETFEPNSIKDPIVDIAFTSFKTALDRDFAKWKVQCKVNAENGARGGRPKKSEITHSVNSVTKKANLTEKSEPNRKKPIV